MKKPNTIGFSDLKVIKKKKPYYEYQFDGKSIKVEHLEKGCKITLIVGKRVKSKRFIEEAGPFESFAKIDQAINEIYQSSI